jgi:hypothetical protein
MLAWLCITRHFQRRSDEVLPVKILPESPVPTMKFSSLTYCTVAIKQSFAKAFNSFRKSPDGVGIDYQ